MNTYHAQGLVRRETVPFRRGINLASTQELSRFQIVYRFLNVEVEVDTTHFWGTPWSRPLRIPGLGFPFSRDFGYGLRSSQGIRLLMLAVVGALGESGSSWNQGYVDRGGARRIWHWTTGQATPGRRVCAGG
jgi:hypothetical protein